MKVAPFQMRSPDFQNRTASDMVGVGEGWRERKDRSSGS